MLLNINIVGIGDVIALLHRIVTNQERLRELVSAEWDDLKAAVAANTDVEKSAIVLINGLGAKIDALGDAPKPEELAALSAEVKAEAADLAAAVAANTGKA